MVFIRASALSTAAWICACTASPIAAIFFFAFAVNVDTSALPPVLEPRFHYRGSLTTPPCTENVNWVVFKTPVTLSHEQVVQLQALMPLNNYRGTQELGDRRVVQVVH